jgi:Colicin V production protein
MLAAIDSTPGQVTADLLLLALVCANAYLGWRYGLLRRVVGLVGVFVACFAASNVGNGLVSIFGMHSLSANAWGFVVIFLGVVVMVEGIGALIHERLQRVLVVLFDRLSGTLLGVGVGLAQALILFLVAFAVTAAPASSKGGGETLGHAIVNATVAGPASRLEPQLTRIFSFALPSDLSNHLQQGTAATSPA